MKRLLASILTLCLIATCAALAEADRGAPKTETVISIRTAAEAPAEEPTEAPTEATTEAPTEAPTDAPTEAPTEAPAEGDGLGSALLPSPEEVSAEVAESEAPAAASESFVLWFDEGFGLSLPEGWVCYDVNAEDAKAGIRYALGDATGARYLYIQLTDSRYEDIEALTQAVDAAQNLMKSGRLTFGGLEFVSFIDQDRNASCCATVWGENLLVFIFTPQNDLDYMLDASRMMETFIHL